MLLTTKWPDELRIVMKVAKESTQCVAVWLVPALPNSTDGELDFQVKAGNGLKNVS